MMPNHDAIVAIAKAIEPRLTDADDDRSSREIAEQIMLDLDAAGYTVKPKPKSRKAAPRREPFVANTGDPQIDDFMRRHHDPKWKPLPLPKSPGLPSIGMSEKLRDYTESTWASACEAARAEVARGEIPVAQITLAETIRVHRSPWTRRGNVYRSTEHDWRIERHSAIGENGWKLYDPDGNLVMPPKLAHGTRSDHFFRFDDAERMIPAKPRLDRVNIYRVGDAEHAAPTTIR